MDLPLGMVGRSSSPSLLLVLGEGELVLGVLLFSLLVFWRFYWMLAGLSISGDKESEFALISLSKLTLFVP